LPFRNSPWHRHSCPAQSERPADDLRLLAELGVSASEHVVRRGIILIKVDRFFAIGPHLLHEVDGIPHAFEKRNSPGRDGAARVAIDAFGFAFTASSHSRVTSGICPAALFLVLRYVGEAPDVAVRALMRQRIS